MRNIFIVFLFFIKEELTMANENIQANKLNNLIDIQIDKFLPVYKNEGNLDYMQEGIISQVLSDNRCVVKINGVEKNLPFADNLNLSVGNVVIILLYNFDKNRRMVIAKRPSKW
jgi:hypothetical protein